MKQARAEGVKVIFFQPQFDVRAAGVVAEAIGGAAAPIDSLWADAEKNMDEIAAKIRRIALARGVRKRSPSPSGRGLG